MKTAARQKSLTAQHQKHAAETTKRHAKVRELKRTDEAQKGETEAMRSEFTARTRSHPEEFDRGGRPLPGTEAEKLARAISPRMEGALLKTDPKLQAEIDQAVAALHEAQRLELEFKLTNFYGIVSEIEPPMDDVLERVGTALLDLKDAFGDYRLNEEALLELIHTTDQLDGRDLVADGRIAELVKLVDGLLDSPLITPHIGDRGAYKIELGLNALKAEVAND